PQPGRRGPPPGRRPENGADDSRGDSPAAGTVPDPSSGGLQCHAGKGGKRKTPGRNRPRRSRRDFRRGEGRGRDEAASPLARGPQGSQEPGHVRGPAQVPRGFLRKPADPLRRFRMRLWIWIDGRMVRLGEVFLGKCRTVAEFLRFCAEMFLAIPSVFKNIHFTIDQMYLIGITSIPLVGLTSIFTGAVAAWQAAYNFADYVPLRYVGTAVGKSVMLEVGPVLTALVVAGRVGASMTAELGTMAVTEQLDAMKVLALNPFRFLMAPRLLASMIMLPMLTIFSSFIAILGALAVVTLFKDLSS